ncbi:MAG: methyltransferase domain-containing protein [Betaproteobacteria bacterium]
MIVFTFMSRQHFQLIATAWLACLAMQSTFAADSGPYQNIKPSIDGIGKSYMGREIAGVMGWQAATWLERPERAKEERPDLLLTELQLKPGMVVADIGAGSGYHSRRMADAVGKTGKVYAVDVQPQMVQMLSEIARDERFSNVKAILSAVDDVRLPADSVDLAIMVDVYHELEFPLEVLQSIVRSLKPGGRVAFVEYRAEDANVAIKPLHKMSEAQVRREAARLPLAWERTSKVLPWQHIVMFRKLAK